MKVFLHKYAYLIAVVFILTGMALFFLTKPNEPEQIDSELFVSDRTSLDNTLQELEVLGFADTLSAQKEELKKALVFYKQSKYSKAEEALNEFLISYPGHMEAEYYLGLAYLFQEKNIASKNILSRLAGIKDFELQEDAEWFAMLASSNLDNASSLNKLRQLSGSPDSKYHQAAAALMATLSMNPGSFSYKKADNQTESTANFAIVIQPSNPWWQQPVFRSSLLFLLPIGSISLVMWKRKISEMNEELIREEVVLRTAEIKLEKEAIEKEKNISEKLLNNILPAETAAALKHGQTNTKRHEMVTVLFCDFEGFTSISEKLTPEQLVRSLGICFEAFDHIIEEEKLEKIKTVGDCYICAAGLKSGKKEEAKNIINAAKKMVAFLENFNQSQIKLNMPSFIGRIGVNTGPVVAGIVGIKKYSYDIWGDTVNIAARMEQASKGGRINISGSTYELVKNHFKCEHRGKIEAKGKGAIDMYFID